MSRNGRLLTLLLLTLGGLTLCLFMGGIGLGLPDIHTPIGRTILQMRISRIFAGFAVGAALSCAGVIFQAILRNPLAEPYILGISSGSGLGAALAILTGLGSFSLFSLPVFAFIAGASTLGVVYLLGSNRGVPSIYGLILSGVIVSSICSSLLMFLVALAPAEGLHSVLWWMLGNLEPASRPLLGVSAGFMLFGILVAWCLSPELNVLTLGRETAHNIGIQTTLVVVVSLTLATLITASAVGLAGLIGFVGLIVPHVMRSLVGPDHRVLIPAAALGGGLFLALCDAVARTILAPVEIPVGVVTALCGGPFFLFILRRRQRAGSIE